MDIKQYIESGIIESYVLGTTSDQETREVECMANIYPEIKQELEASLGIIENYVQSLAKDPPKYLKELILKKIREVDQEGKTEAKIDLDKETRKVVSINRNSKGLRVALAASVALVLGLGVILYTINSSKTNLEQNLADKTKAFNELEVKYDTEINRLNTDLAEIQDYQDIILNRETQNIDLNGTDFSPQSQAKVFYHAESSQLVYYGDKMPSPGELTQYQLWAISDGTPIDLGVINKDSNLFKLKIDPQQVDAFAITLEPNGGSETPTLEQLFVIGNV